MSLDKIVVIAFVLIALAAIAGINLKARSKERKEQLEAMKKSPAGDK